MKRLFKGINALIAGQNNFTRVDLEVVEGVITKIGEISATEGHEVVDIEGLHCCTAFFDPFVNFCEPGLEHKENLKSGIDAAAFGGFSQVAIMPDTEPYIDNRPQLDFIKSSAKNGRVSVEVMPLFTKAQNDDELSEIGEMADAGAIAFSQKEFTVLKPSVLLKALEYSKVAGKKIVVHATDYNLVPGAFIHEGEANVMIGMRGIPAFSEELLVKQYIELLRYSDASMHISGISTLESVELVAEAKESGLRLTADTSVYNLLFTDKDTADFDTNFKLNPPLRSENDRASLVEAVKKGVIDSITCKHSPQDEDLKKTEMKMAAFGVIGLQTAFSALVNAVGLNKAVDILSNQNRKAFGIGVPKVKVGQRAELALFVPDEKWGFNQKNNLSKSENSMFLNKQLLAKPYGILNGNSLVLNE